MRFDRIIQKRIRRSERGVQVALDVNARVAVNIDHRSGTAPAGGGSFRPGPDEKRGEPDDGRLQEADT
jgi:hypothetical protein